MRTLLLTVAYALMLCVADVGAQPAKAPADTPRYALEVQETKRVVGVLTYDLSCPDVQVNEWIIFAAVGPELPGQTKVKTTLSPAAVQARDRSPLGRELLLARVPAKTRDLQHAVPIKVTYEATLHSRTLKTLEPDAKADKVADLPPADRKLYLAERGDIDFKQDAFKKWLKDEKLTRAADESDIDFARRAFLAIKVAASYEYDDGLDRRTSNVCKSCKSDCGGLSALFVAALRANGVPARSLYGRWAESAKPEQKLGKADYFQWHVKAEFFADGVGWVPVDVAAGVQFDKTKEGVKYFGADPGNFITFHIDANFELDTKTFGVKPAPNLQGPGWWVTGKGSTDSRKVNEDWKVEAQK